MLQKIAEGYGYASTMFKKACFHMWNSIKQFVIDICKLSKKCKTFLIADMQNHPEHYAGFKKRIELAIALFIVSVRSFFIKKAELEVEALVEAGIKDLTT